MFSFVSGSSYLVFVVLVVICVKVSCHDAGVASSLGHSFAKFSRLVRKEAHETSFNTSRASSLLEDTVQLRTSMDSTADWAGIKTQLEPHRSLTFTRSQVRALFEAVQHKVATLLVTVEKGKLHVKRSKAWRGVHKPRARWTIDLLQQVVHTLPDTQFVISLQDCGLEDIEHVDQEVVRRTLFFASTWKPGATALSFPINLLGYFRPGKARRLDHTIKTLTKYNRKRKWQHKSSAVFWRGNHRLKGGQRWNGGTNREKLFKLGKAYPKFVDVVKEDVSIRDQLAKHRNFFYVPGYCGWSGSLDHLALGDGVLFAFNSSNHEFLELELTPHKDYVPIPEDTAEEDVLKIVKETLSQPRKMQRLRTSLKAKARKLLSLKSISAYVVGIIQGYNTHLVGRRERRVRRRSSHFGFAT
eukprot:TRINITY_DN22296_c0_g2_i1.p1 TRINITY_DN22296_c0_g2~~TRINITY_DN22296_c0_g2_i1.p1  ORF type:complete len:413 (+),score=34.55 TRINITY_DN22296_c0_g2_i1:24-1262(+)